MRGRLRIRANGMLAAVGVVALVGLAPPVRAQSSGAGETSRKRPIGIDELTITARKREGRQDQPLAASAVAGAALADLDVRRAADLGGVVPNLAVGERPGGARLYVRGVGSGDAIASDGPGVGLYLDGVYLTRAEAGLFALPDIERVEVLRGPQGTQSARSTIGGAVNVITRKPTLDELTRRAEVRIGNYDRLDTRLSVNVPLIPELAAARVSFAMASRDGFQKSARSGRDLDDAGLFGLRTQLLAAPSEDVELVLALDGAREDRKPQGYKCRVTGQLETTSPALGLLERCAEDRRRSTRSVAPELGIAKQRLETYGASLTARWNVRDTLTLTSISAWRRHAADAALDGAATPLASAALELAGASNETQQQTSQELQLTGRAAGGRLSYVTGLFWLAEDAAYEAGLQVRSRSYAVYGQGSYDLTERLRVTLGARVDAERKRLERDRFSGATRSSHVSPSAALRYELSDTAHVYGTWSRGFKSGGVDARAEGPALAAPIDGEELTSYEVGFKSLFLDSRLRLNAAVFYSRYDDIQLSGPRSAALASAGSAEIKGAELELRAVPYPGFEISSALGVTDARYTDFEAPRVRVASGDPEGQRLAGTPAYTLGLGASYQLPLGRFGDLRARADWTHVGRSDTDSAGSRSLRKGKRGELDAQLAWTLQDSLTEIVLLGSNLLDRESVVDGIDLGAGALVLYSAPRTYGLEIRRSF